MASRWVTAAVALCGLVLLAGVAGQWIPFLTAERPVITATPSLAGLTQRDEIPVRRGEQACIAPVTFTPESEVARLTVLARPREGVAAPRLRVDVSGDGGYRAAGRVPSFERGTDQLVDVRLTPPEREVRGSLCVRNEGRETIRLIGTAEGRSDRPAQTTVDGRPTPDAALTLLEAKPRSLLSRAATILDRAGDFTGGMLPGWLLGILAVVLLAGTVAGLPWALWRALREDQGQEAGAQLVAERPEPPERPRGGSARPD